ncbi:ATP synthase F1 subunit gamma [Verrucomicrobiaceae bacterium N1E253]|uniref:ATP synthase gamma chain n=1 Tax=Oceaniferula marina TaxID=2748318 RepID=A0A851GKI3_9BACT|nr:ATP synthase F1 subunit gamma [Oceaniferula marina]NWK55685.1 ATP synthase F1 subunit gamma [Oceaniferula marina]
MANLRDIRRRIKSVNNTSQITKAMQLVASAKMKKAQDQALSSRDYAFELLRFVADLRGTADEECHPLLGDPGEGRELVLVVSTDRGLCGGLNTNLLKKLRAEVSEDAHFVTVGSKLRQQLQRTGGEITADWQVKDPVPFQDARPIAKLLTEKFLSEDYGKVTIVYNRFVTTLTQEPRVVQLLPIDQELVASVSAKYQKETDNMEPAASFDYVFEPDVDSVLESLLPLFINYMVYQVLLESRASEHSARMVAMKAATDNAKEIVKDLTLEYNKARQAAITAELLEITTAQKAME